MDLSGNFLSGTLPALPPALQRLDLASNFFTGNLSAVASLAALVHMDASHNSFSGALPRLGRLSRLTALDLAGNALSGTVPGDLASLTHLRLLALASNQLSGLLPPASLPSLTALYLARSGLCAALLPGLPPPADTRGRPARECRLEVAAAVVLNAQLAAVNAVTVPMGAALRQVAPLVNVLSWLSSLAATLAGRGL